MPKYEIEKQTIDLMNKNPPLFKGVNVHTTMYFVVDNEGTASSFIFQRLGEAQDVAQHLSDKFPHKVFHVCVATPDMIAEVNQQLEWIKEFEEANKPAREKTDKELEAEAEVRERTSIEESKVDEALQKDKHEREKYGDVLIDGRPRNDPE